MPNNIEYTKMGFLLYTMTKEGQLGVYYSENVLNNRPFIVEPQDETHDVLAEILDELELEVDSKRISFLGSFNNDGSFGAEEVTREIDAIAIDVSSLNMREFISKWSLKENFAYVLNREENSLLLAMMMKLILTKKKLANVKNKNKEN
jgi:hypothetical protein